jgi:hypothetical protein
VSIVASHKFSTRTGRQEGQCVCGLARSAHAAEIDPYDTSGLMYRCPYCVDRGSDPCLHGRAGALDVQMRRIRKAPGGVLNG